MERLDETIVNIIKNQLLGMDVDTSKTFEDHGFDNLDLANVIMEVEDELSIDIDENKITMGTTIDQFIDFTKNLVEENEENEEPQTDEVL